MKGEGSDEETDLWCKAQAVWQCAMAGLSQELHAAGFCQPGRHRELTLLPGTPKHTLTLSSEAALPLPFALVLRRTAGAARLRLLVLSKPETQAELRGFWHCT